MTNMKMTDRERFQATMHYQPVDRAPFREFGAWPAAIDAELVRIEPLVREGGYIPTTDHSFPPDVSFANYCYFMEKLYSIL